MSTLRTKTPYIPYSLLFILFHVSRPVCLSVFPYFHKIPNNMHVESVVSVFPILSSLSCVLLTSPPGIMGQDGGDLVIDLTIKPIITSACLSAVMFVLL